MSKAVFALARTYSHAQAIIGKLKNCGFTDSDMSVLYPDAAGNQDLGVEKGSKAPEGAATGAGTGGVIGGTVGLLAGLGALAIPGVGPFIAAGPLLAALSGVALGATVGGIAGTLVGYGIPEYEAKAYESKVREGRTLISVHTSDAKRQEAAKKAFKDAAAEDIGVANEATVKA